MQVEVIGYNDWFSQQVFGKAGGPRCPSERHLERMWSWYDHLDMMKITFWAGVLWLVLFVVVSMVAITSCKEACQESESSYWENVTAFVLYVWGLWTICFLIVLEQVRDWGWRECFRYCRFGAYMILGPFSFLYLLVRQWLIIEIYRVFYFLESLDVFSPWSFHSLETMTVFGREAFVVI